MTGVKEKNNNINFKNVEGISKELPEEVCERVIITSIELFGKNFDDARYYPLISTKGLFFRKICNLIRNAFDFLLRILLPKNLRIKRYANYHKKTFAYMFVAWMFYLYHEAAYHEMKNPEQKKYLDSRFLPKILLANADIDTEPEFINEKYCPASSAINLFINSKFLLRYFYELFESFKKSAVSYIENNNELKINDSLAIKKDEQGYYLHLSC